MAAERIFIVGASGSGKSTLAAELGRRTSLPVHDLDRVARVAGGTSPLRPETERDELVARIISTDRWVAEGIHLGWTAPLLEAADTIVWLDNVSWRGASGRMVRRFASQAVAEARRQKGWRRLFRFRDYARRLRELLRAIPESRSYHRGQAGISRSATEEALAPYAGKVTRCTTQADVEAVLGQLSAR
jgi:adenylate kinase family enzyme